MRVRNIATLAAATALAVSASLASSGTAMADDATDQVNAATAYAGLVAAATVNNATLNAAHAADITCDTPKAVGVAVTPALNIYPVGITYGNDIGQGDDECLSLQRTPFTYRLVVQILKFDASVSAYVPIPECSVPTVVSGTAISGIAVAPSPPVPCTYAPPARLANGKHIVRALMYTSLTGLTTNPYTGYSLPYDTVVKASI